MKKTIIILLTLCLCMTLCSCNIKPKEIHPPHQPPIVVTYLERYEIALCLLTLPDNFVYYEDVKEFGEFYSFAVLSDFPFDNLDQEVKAFEYDFDYTATTGKSRLLSLEIKPAKRINIDNIEELPVAFKCSTDMRNLPDAENKNYALGELVYTYDGNGELYTIKWYYNGHTFCLWAIGLDDYPKTDETLVGRLLNSDTAVEAIESVFDFEADNASEGG